MANLLYQQIEMLSREKHIEPEVVVSAIEDAMVVAARKHYKTEEDLRAKFNQTTSGGSIFGNDRGRGSRRSEKRSQPGGREKRIHRLKLVWRLLRTSRPMHLGALRRRRSSR